MTESALELDRVEKELLGRWPESRIEWKLERMTALMHVLGDPHLAYPVVHVAGTNGKTSTSRMIDALLRSLDLRTGRFTSPHLESILERICIDGEPLAAARSWRPTTRSRRSSILSTRVTRRGCRSSKL